jgi:thymidine kinase
MCPVHRRTPSPLSGRGLGEGVESTLGTAAGEHFPFVKVGSIEVIAGPMFSGKTEELIRRMRRADLARLETQLFKHDADVRYSREHVVSHSQWQLPSQTVRSASEIAQGLRPLVRVVGIDEAQFFDDALVDLAISAANRGIRVILAGLDLDYRGRPFGPMPQLLAVANEVTKINAICMQCGEPAHFSQRLSPSSEHIVIGANDVYEARCRRCFIPSGTTGPSPASPLSASNGKREKR